MIRGNLTKRQSDVYDFIVRKITIENIPPSIKEICEEFSIKSTNAVYELLNVLEKKGYIERSKRGASRSIKLINKKNENFNDNKQVIELNIAGKGDAKNPLSIFLNSKDKIFLDKDFFRLHKGSHFAAYIEDDGLGKDGIKRGDLVLVAQGKSLDSGTIVAVLYEDKILARILDRFESYDELYANVRGYPKIKIKKGSKDAVIIGKIIGVIRKFI